MKRILFVTNRNVLTTSGELRLIKNRAEVLYHKYGIATDFIVLANRKRIEAENREVISAGGSIKTIELSLSNPITILICYKKIVAVVQKLLATEKYQALVLSGAGMPMLTKRIRRTSDIRILFDIHGASEDIWELAKAGNVSRKIKFMSLYLLDRITLKKNLRYANGCFVVTKALEDYLRKRYILSDKVSFYVAPCATSTQKMDDVEYQIYRKEYRLKYQISDNTPVFIYSGGVSSWQCIKETVELFQEIAQKLNDKPIMLIFSHDIDKIREIIKDNPMFVTGNFTPDELRKVLCAGDYAFLLRKDCVTNNVAFPNKYLEYVQSRMRVISTPFINEIANQIDNYQLGYLYRMDGNVDSLLTYIEKNKVSDVNRLKRIENVLDYNSFENRLCELAKEISYESN